MDEPTTNETTVESVPDPRGGVAQLPSAPARLLAWWKRSLLLDLSIGAGIVLAAAAIVGRWEAYHNRPSPPRTWHKVNIRNLGIRLSLKTEWRDGDVMYQFSVTPQSPDLSAAFSEALASPSTIRFSVLLNDKTDSQICECSLNRNSLTRTLTSRGKW